MTPNFCFLKNNNMGIKNAEFYADFKFVEKNCTFSNILIFFKKRINGEVYAYSSSILRGKKYTKYRKYIEKI